jgi:hypothetical protein
MYVCMYAYLYVCMYHMYACMHICRHFRLFSDHETPVFKYIHTCTNIVALIQRLPNTCLYAHTCIHTYIHFVGPVIMEHLSSYTYIHTYIQSRLFSDYGTPVFYIVGHGVEVSLICMYSAYIHIYIYIYIYIYI